MNKTLVALAGIAAFLVVAYLGYNLLAPTVNQCEGIFQQTAPSLEANVKFLETQGGVLLGNKQLQELSGHAQEIALNLKSCCVMAGAGNYEQFNQCKASAVLYDKQVTEAVAAVKSVADADAADKAERQQKATEQLAQILKEATAASQSLQKQVEEIDKQQSQPAGQGPQATSTNNQASSDPGTLHVRAALADGGEKISACFYVLEPQEDLQGKRKQINSSCGDNVVFSLPPGDYFISATAGDASVSTPLAVQGGQTTEHVFTLNAGYLRARAVLSEAGEASSACFYILEAKEDLQGKHRQINSSCGEKAIFTLPAGKYLGSAASGDASKSAEVSVQAGQITDQVFNLNAGYLRTKAALIEQGDPLSACFYVLDPKEDLQGNHKSINSSCGDKAIFTLPAGDYLASATAGDASRTTKLAVQPGQITDYFFALNAGHLRARATLAEGGPPVNACFRIYEPKEDLQGNRRQVNSACTDNAVFTLPVGTYVLSAQSGDASASTTFEIKPGEVTDSTLALAKP